MKLNLLLFAIGLVLGLYLSFMYCVATHTAAHAPVPALPVKKLQKEVAASEKVFAAKLDSLKAENRKLETRVNTAKAALQKAKSNSARLQTKTKNIIQQNLKAQESPYAYDPSCDSLITTAEALMQASVEKDSLYEGVVKDIEAQVANRDSTISLLHERHHFLTTAFEKSIQSLALVQKENTVLTKAARRQKIKSKVFSAALFILSGAAAGYLLTR